MHFIRRVLSYFDLSSSNNSVMIEQISALSKQVPALYASVSINVVAIAVSHYGITPPILTVYLPVVMIIISLLRITSWFFSQHKTLIPEKARKRLYITYFYVVVMTSVFVTWTLSLFSFGSQVSKSHIAFFLATNLFGCIYCLMHLRPAALMASIILVVPTSFRLISEGDLNSITMAIGFLLGSVVLIYMTFRHNNDFINLIRSKQKLIQSHQKLHDLNIENNRIANTDYLTQLPNRRAFFHKLAMLEAEAATLGSCYIIGLIDLDGFKAVNDAYGHNAGDSVIVEIGNRLRRTLDASCSIARLGGDEFALVLPGATSLEQLRRCGDSICEAARVPIALGQVTAQVGASIGFAKSSPDLSLDTLIEQADYALYHAKARKRGTAVIFAAKHKNEIHLKSLIEQEMRLSNFAEQASIKFQPIVDSERRQVIAYEALARWTSPNFGGVSPDIFIPIAERSGLMNSLTEVLFSKALAAMATWPDNVSLSFNLSVQDLISPNLIGFIIRNIVKSGLHAERFCFEVTETALINDFDQVRVALENLKLIGAKIALDDFGTGYSSLSYIHQLPLDRIKIDRSFLKTITINNTSKNIVKSIVYLTIINY